MCVDIGELNTLWNFNFCLNKFFIWLSVKVSSGTSFKKSAINNFSKAHEKLYGFKSDDNIINVINIRLVAQGKKKKSRVPKDLKMKIGNNKSSMIIKRPVYFGKKLGWVDTPQLLRSNITNNWLKK